MVSRTHRATVALAFIICCAQAGLVSAQKRPPAQPLNLNVATLEQLEQLPGIGPSTAKAIVQFRAMSGPFRRVEELLAIHGISNARLEKLRPYVTIGPPPGKK